MAEKYTVAIIGCGNAAIVDREEAKEAVINSPGCKTVSTAGSVGIR